MFKSANLAAWFCRGVAGCMFAGLTTVASAAPTWVESNALDSSLDGNWTYTSDALTRTGTVSYHNQVATNTSASTAHLGMYIGWVWTYDGAGASTSLAWSNTDQAFIGSGVKMTVAGNTGSIKLGDIGNDTWIGNPWTPGAPTPGIATDASWVVPLFDFGNIAGGASAFYDIALTVTFDTQAAFDDWNRAGSYYVGGQGIALVPEPGSLALVALALVGAGLGLRRRAR